MHALCINNNTFIFFRIYELYLPRNSLSVDGLDVLLGVVHGCQLTNTVLIGPSQIEPQTINRIKKRYIRYGITLLTDDLIEILSND